MQLQQVHILVPTAAELTKRVLDKVVGHFHDGLEVSEFGKKVVVEVASGQAAADGAGALVFGQPLVANEFFVTRDS